MLSPDEPEDGEKKQRDTENPDFVLTREEDGAMGQGQTFSQKSIWVLVFWLFEDAFINSNTSMVNFDISDAIVPPKGPDPWVLGKKCHQNSIWVSIFFIFEFEIKLKCMYNEI